MKINDHLINKGSSAIEEVSFPAGILPLGIAGRKLIAEAVLKAVATPDRKPTDIVSYRPLEYDDWGFIRNTDGSMYAAVRRPLDEEEANTARRERTDPFEALGTMLVSCVNQLAAIPLDERTRLIEVCAQLAANEQATCLLASKEKGATMYEKQTAEACAETAERIAGKISELSAAFTLTATHE